MKNKSLKIEKNYINLEQQFFKKDQEITIMLWFNIENAISEQAILSQNYDRGIHKLELGIYDKKLFYYTYENDVIRTSEIENNKWYHIAYTYKNNTLTGYLNGKYDFSMKIKDFQNDNTYLLSYTQGSDFFLKGLIDEVKIYDYALSNNEIKYKMNKIENNNNHLLRYYNFNEVFQDNIIKDLSKNHKDLIIKNFKGLSDDAPILVYIKYLLKQDNQYYSIKTEFYDKEKKIYLPCERDFNKNGIDDLYQLTTNIEINNEVFNPIMKFKSEIELIQAEEK